MIVRSLTTEWSISVDLAKVYQFDRALEDAKKTANGAGESIKRMGDGIASAGAKLTAFVTLPLTALGAVSLRNAARMEALQMGLETLMGSAAAAREELVKLNEVAKLPGLGLPEAVQGSLRLQGAGMAADVARNTLMQFANAVASVGGGREQLDGITLALTQISAKGKVMAQEINQIAERLPQIRLLMTSAFGTANSEAIQEMGLSSEAFIAGIVKELEKLPRMTGGLRNSFENLSDAWLRFTAALGRMESTRVQAIFDKLAGALDFIAQKIDALPQPMKDFLAVAVIAAAALGPLLLVIGKIVSLVGSVLFMKVAVAALGISLGTIAATIGGILLTMAAWASAIIGIGALLYMFFNNAGAIFLGIGGFVADLADDIVTYISEAVMTAIDWLKKIPSEVITYVKGVVGLSGLEGQPDGVGGSSVGGGMPMPPSAVNNSSTANSTSISAPITVNVPEGTTAEQADNIARIASKTVTAHLDTMLRNAQGAYR